jgi:hypothetical protein
VIRDRRPATAPGIIYTIRRGRTGLTYGARLGDVPDTSSFGCLSWPACVAGGTLCVNPNDVGASLNPCCHFAPPTGPCPDSIPPVPNSDGSYGFTGSLVDTAAAAAQAAVSGVVPSWIWMAGLGLAGFVVVQQVRR